MYMSHFLLGETDEAFLARVNLHFHLDDDPTRSWDECPLMIETWVDVLRSFVVDKHGSKGIVPRALMHIFSLERILTDEDHLACRAAVHKKRVYKALIVLEKGGWISRLSKSEVCINPRLIQRAKRIYQKLAWSAGYEVNVDANTHEISEQISDHVRLRQTPYQSVDPRRTLDARTFFVPRDKTS
jgi:hypothetical protein